MLIRHLRQITPLSVILSWIQSLEGEGAWPATSNNRLPLDTLRFQDILRTTSSLVPLASTLSRDAIA